MSIMVLNGPRLGFQDRYRGTARFPPCHWDKLGDDCEANRLFFWFLDVSDGDGVIRATEPIEHVLNIAEVYSRLDPSHPFEVIESVPEGQNPSAGDEFLGIDLSLNGVGDSLLVGWGASNRRR